MVIGTIIGASIFVQPSAVTRVMPSMGGVLLTWTVAGGITVVLGALFVSRHGFVVSATAADAPLVPSAGAFVTALIAGLFAYGGWHMVTYASEETRDPTRTIPRALLVGTLIVTAAYVA